MERLVNRAFVCFLIQQYYLDKQNHFDSLHSENDRWGFYDLNRLHDKWFIIFHRKLDCQITLFPVFI